MAMIQYGLWPNCTNNCDFCLLKDRVYKTVPQRLNLLKAVKKNLILQDYENKFSDGISLLGGEIFYTESPEVKTSFLDLIEIIIKTILKPYKNTKLSVVSNGIYNPNELLIPVLDMLKENNVLDKLDLNFSYDLKYRFKTQKAQDTMIANTNLVYNQYAIKPWVQTILTQYLIDAHFNNTFCLWDFQQQHLPNTKLALLYPHKINTGKILPDFFFTRKSLFQFIKYLKTNNQTELVDGLRQSVINSSQFKYVGLLYRDSVYTDSQDDDEIDQKPNIEIKQHLLPCGHSDLYRCYSDCDRCLLCDLETML